MADGKSVSLITSNRNNVLLGFEMVGIFAQSPMFFVLEILERA